MPIDELTFGSLRGSMGFVSQDVFLFQGTVRENLTYGRPDATDDDVVWAARLAEAHDFVSALPDGYDTIVGERGQKLSGGQRQRLTIARAILRDPAILVLDEATSAVDNETEAAIQRSIAHVSADRTTIVIAHRLSTVRHAHRIHVLEAGRIIEAGTHEELVDARRPLRRPLARPDRRGHRRRRRHRRLTSSASWQVARDVGTDEELLRGEALAQGVLGADPGVEELVEVVGAAGLGADAAHAVAAEGLAADDGAGDVAVEVHVAGPQLGRGPLEVHRRAREAARR